MPTPELGQIMPEEPVKHTPPTGSPLDRLAAFFTSVTGLVVSVTALAGAIVGLVVLLQGGDDPRQRDTPQVQTQPVDTGPTLEEWASQINAICRETRNKITALNQQLVAIGTPQTQDQFSAMIDVYDAQVQTNLQATARSRAVQPPPSHQLDSQRMFDLHEEAYNMLAVGLNETAQSGDPTYYNQALQRASKVSAQGDAIADALGATDCLG